MTLLHRFTGPARPLHPVAWWAWAIGLAVAASTTTNPLTLGLILVVVSVVVTARRSGAAWSKGLRGLLALALLVIAIRVVFRALLGAGGGGTVLFTLPELVLPEAAAGIRIGGPVTLEGLLVAVVDGMRLATLLVAVASANLLADARRLLKVAPAAVYEIGTAVVVAIAVAPRLVERGQRVRQARRLRGASPSLRPRELRATLLPVLEDALDGAIAQAAAMDTRGYGRSAHLSRSERRVTTGMTLLALGGLCVGTYGLLDATTPAALGFPVLGVAVVVGLLAVRRAGRSSIRTVYRPDPWTGPEWLTAMAGAVVALAALVLVRTDPAAVAPSLNPLAWPVLPPVMLGALLLAALPAVLTPDPNRPIDTTQPAPAAVRVATPEPVAAP